MFGELKRVKRGGVYNESFSKHETTFRFRLSIVFIIYSQKQSLFTLVINWLAGEIIYIFSSPFS